MKDFQTVYPLFEDSIDQVIMKINKSLEFDDPTPRNIIFLQSIKSDLVKVIDHLNKKPSIHLVNLGKALNDLYLLDKSAEILKVVIKLKEQPDPLKVSLITLSICET